jgi:hypothetical protein
MYTQDCRQHILVAIEFCIEIYRVIVGTCLITFVPKVCGTTNCGYIWITTGKTIFDVAFYVNLATLFSFLCLYAIELMRENRIITYLEVNPNIGTDNKVTAEIIRRLNPVKRSNLYRIDTIYVSVATFCMVCFGVNTTISGVVLLKDLENKTIFGFITSILFMMTKLYRIYIIINTEKNVFYSAYLMNFVQFNDLDPREIEWIEAESKERIETEDNIIDIFI